MPSIDPPEVRVTFLLPYKQHQQLHTTCTALAGDLGVPRVAAAEVCRALLDEFHSDTALRNRVTGRITAARALAA